MPAAKPDTVKAGEIYAMLKRQSFRCAYSGRELTPETASIDHRQPISRGGSNELPNLAVVHVDVNAAKASMTVEEFVQLCREVVEWSDSQQTNAIAYDMTL